MDGARGETHGNQVFLGDQMLDFHAYVGEAAETRSIPLRTLAFPARRHPRVGSEIVGAQVSDLLGPPPGEEFRR
jgi:hypothetical protein